MEKKDFTLIDAFNQFWEAWEWNSEKRTLTCVGLYFYLVKQWNACGRALQFRHRNTKICEELGISKPTLEANRNWLKQAGLIDFYSKGKGDPNITYEIRKRSKTILLPEEVKKENNFTSDFTSHFTSDFPHKQSNNYNIITLGEEVKSFYYLKELLMQDEGMKVRWMNYGYKIESFADGIDSFLTLKQGSKYKDFHDFRNNFYYWIPNYALELKKRNQVKSESAEKKQNESNYRLKKI
jgi:hypothetical protein